MFYEPNKDDHGLPFNPYKSIVVPRPIGWISTISRDRVVNLAPYSQFNNLGYDPPYVMFSANSFPGTGHRKDSVRNAMDTGEFVVNMATYDLRESVNITSQFLPPAVDEAALASLDMIPCVIVKAPRVAASPVHLECKLHCSFALPGNAYDQVHNSRFDFHDAALGTECESARSRTGGKTVRDATGTHSRVSGVQINRSSAMGCRRIDLRLNGS
jgi:flavin reductase (DIM6/NTAB) family NADH-FMN oxidoreductase RutF